MAMHATTKYLGGRSDVLGGVAVARADDERFAQVRTAQLYGGAVPSPFDCWLVMRSLPTLPYRMRAHCDNAMKVATFLAAHPEVSAVHYPGLPDNAFHALAKRQMAASAACCRSRCAAARRRRWRSRPGVELFTRATSLGGVESLIEHRASIEGPESRTPQGLLRVSVGLEHADDLIDDLAQALDPLATELTAAARRRRTAVALVVLSQWLGTSLWFSPSGAADGLMARLAIDSAAFGWLIAATQLGFIAGTLAFAATGLADRFAREPHLRRQLRRRRGDQRGAGAARGRAIAAAWRCASPSACAWPASIRSA